MKEIYIKETKVYIAPGGQSMVRIPKDIARILEGKEWESGQAFLKYDKDNPNQLIIKRKGNADEEICTKAC